MAEKTYTAGDVIRMVAHIKGCAECYGGDQEILDGLHEGLPPEEIDAYITTAHDPAWVALTERNGRPEHG
ncbi:hypothetical protein AB0D67_37835 [Streptosporangium sp. NPDC048047]|uniref:hypothetical protein n=1 Tax=Streptosporangium sp. NPDC048047 TaxID=3155748 RepID=UPI003416749D